MYSLKCVVFVIVIFNSVNIDKGQNVPIKPSLYQFLRIFNEGGSDVDCDAKELRDRENQDVSEVATGDNLQYQFFPVLGSSLQFKVRARNDAHIALAMHPKESDPMYEVVIGGWGNTKSVIRRRVFVQRQKYEVQTPQYLKEDEFRGFWVQWNEGIVTVGREGESSPFLSWRDTEPFPIGFAGVHTGFGSSGIWRFDMTEFSSGQSNSSTVDKFEVSTEDNKKYQFFPVKGNTLRFKVRARNDAHIALSPNPWASGPMYEIVIGGWTNKKSAIRRRFSEQTDKDTVLTPEYLSEEEFRGFWMRWDKGIVLVGRDGEASPFLSWHDPDPFTVSFIGVHTGFGSSGTWKIENVPLEQNNINNEVTTADNTKYQFFPVTGTSVQFKVHARNDAHVALTTHPRESAPMYELVIGGWSNTWSVIRRKTCFAWEKDEVPTASILSPSEMRAFWIRWAGGKILVGREGEDKPFMSWHDPEPLPVAYVGVHTGFGSTGTWEIDSLNDDEGSKSVSTGDNLQYQYFPTSTNFVKFKVRANNDAHIGLSSDSRDSDPMYEIVIGGWGNSKSVVRRKACFQTDKDEASTSGYLSESESRGFWINWANGRILVGRDGESKPFMSWYDFDPLEVKYVSVHTGFGSTGNWKIMNAPRDNAEDEVTTEDDKTYHRYFPVSGKSLQFKVRARNDAHIGLSSIPRDSDPMYEIVIGGWDNTKSVIRKLCCQKPEKVEVKTPQILNDGGFRGFWVRWAGGHLKAGREGEKQPFMEWQDPDPFPIKYLGVHTGFGSSGTWKIGTASTASAGDRNNNVVPLQLPVETPAPPVCEPSLTRLRQGTACVGQVIFEENFDALRENVWQVQQYVPFDHPELPFVSYQRFTVSVKNGHLRIIPALQQIQPGFTYYSMYGSLDLYEGCTSGQSSSCRVEASDGSTIIPPVVAGRITSKSSFAFTYGTISVRAKLPQGDWIYPEILLEPLIKRFVYGTKNSGILKIACARGNKDLHKGSTQYGNKVLYSGPVLDTKCHDTLYVSKTSDKFWGDDFHVYSVKWTPERLIMSVDGEEYARVEPGSNGLRGRLPQSCQGPQQQQGMAPFDDHYYITLGLAVGGHSEFPDGCVSTDGRKKPWKNHASKASLNFWNDIDAWHDTWELPKMIVDYVKVEAL